MDSATTTQEQILLQKLKEMVRDLLLVLSEKEKYIIIKRFGLEEAKRETLEKIGKHFDITRERVRQIENNAIRKLQRTALNTNFKAITDYGKILIEKCGGLVLEEKLLSEILNAVKLADQTDPNDIKLSIRLNKDITKIFNTINYHPHWRLNTITQKAIDEVAKEYFDLLERKGKVIDKDELAEKICKKLTNIPYLTTTLAKSIFEIDKRLKIVPEGVGLFEWRDINPRTLRDKIIYILRRHTEPLHFIELANKITNFQFDNKVINTQAVHNELIRNDQFVLIGRGIYALKEWGYESGTVSDVLKKILADGKPKAQEDIVKAVLHQRKVKKITVLLNLKNKPYFERIGRKMYRYVKV